MTNLDGLMKIGDFARATETNLRTLRYYEELNLLQPNKRSDGGFRFYRTVDLHRVRTIQNLQELGLSLEKIGEVLSHRHKDESREELMARVVKSLKEQVALIAARMERLDSQQKAIAEAMEKLHTCASCEHTPSEGNNWCEPCLITDRSLPSSLSALF